MEAEFSDQFDGWGEWALGDLIVPIARAVRVVGPLAPVQSVVSEAGGGDVPRVELRVREIDEAARLREEAELGEFFVRFVDEPQDEGWEALVNGIRLAVVVKEEW